MCHFDTARQINFAIKSAVKLSKHCVYARVLYILYYLSLYFENVLKFHHSLFRLDSSVDSEASPTRSSGKTKEDRPR